MSSPTKFKPPRYCRDKELTDTIKLIEGKIQEAQGIAMMCSPIESDALKLKGTLEDLKKTYETEDRLREQGGPDEVVITGAHFQSAGVSHGIQVQAEVRNLTVEEANSLMVSMPVEDVSTAPEENDTIDNLSIVHDIPEYLGKKARGKRKLEKEPIDAESDGVPLEADLAS